jgi:ABC-type nitrate/sulfonate/bicarbonate transport system permease component
MAVALGAGKLRLTRALATHAFTLSALAAWEIASWHTPVFLLPGPAPVAKSLWALISTPAGLAQTVSVSQPTRGLTGRQSSER